MADIRFPRPLAFVFSGGLARAAGQIGMCQAALDRGIYPDLIVGTSTGAINAAVLAYEPDTFEESATALWDSVAHDKALSSTWRSTLRGLAGGGSTRTQTMLRKHLDGIFGSRGFADLRIPLIAVSTDLSTGHASVINGGTVVDTLLSSAAFPIIMPPVPADGDVLIDGSVVAGVPVTQAVNAGAKSILVFDTGPSSVDDADVHDLGWYEVLALAFTHLVRGQADHDLALVSQKIPTVVITLGEGDPFNLRKATTVIGHGRGVAQDVLDELGPAMGHDYRVVSKPGLYGNYATGGE